MAATAPAQGALAAALARRRTPDDGDILILPTPASPPLDPDDPISCECGPGDVWSAAGETGTPRYRARCPSEHGRTS